MKKQPDFSKITKLSDKELVSKVKLAATLVGADSNKLNEVLKDTTKLRAMIGSLSRQDIDKLISTIGEEKAKNISDIIDGTK